MPQGATSLTFTFVGMEPQEVAIGTLTQIDVTMAESSFGLDEVVVIGYGTQTRKDITGSISSVKATSLEKRSIASVTQGLQGLVPGLNIAERNASPGQLGAITIRGASSITAGTDPLWVVDGFPTDQRNAASLNPSDIESVEVLKDASATAIFGSRGSNGVILVTTKSGKSGAAQFDVNVSGGVSSVPSSFRVETIECHKSMYNIIRRKTVVFCLPACRIGMEKLIPTGRILFTRMQFIRTIISLRMEGVTK